MERNIYNPGASGVWDQNNSVALGQKKLIDNSRVFLGADTDSLLELKDRKYDDCHFGSTGQIKTASAYSEAIKKYRLH
jgi:uncharacterized protein YdgA (DUF945 family)